MFSRGSYGVLIYELLTGGPPFYSSDKQELKRQILGMDPRRFNLSFPPDMPTSCAFSSAHPFKSSPSHPSSHQVISAP